MQRKSVTNTLRSRSCLWEKANESNIQEIVETFDLEIFTENLDQIRENVFDGELGQRGEPYVIVQAILFLGILLGFVPVVEDTIDFFFGPLLFLAGMAIVAFSVLGLGKSLSPWPVPVLKEKSDGLITTGFYAQMRHPIYSGAIMASTGLSIITHSSTRLLLTAFLIFLFDIKSSYEEEALEIAFPSYKEYQEQVPSKFIPKSLIIFLGENKEE
eukprot:CAMPEP_0178894738 /NCGR_PEP_ID=MMETSP0786-20121207/186_1 /TAXON_ID=186022 /ORGANISM="Thalassionema frauenfeldii, Strain CCMP 1798" /LENGTH=213 /DNA_ID=CAMNT_0020564867 /DNA_START=123 /DNA_END=764 /DNA_ORIENTATION=-